VEEVLLLAPAVVEEEELRLAEEVEEEVVEASHLEVVELLAVVAVGSPHSSL
jgi:hypothetical protein